MLNRCLEQDWFLLPFELRLQRAHARALAAAKILSPAELLALERATETLDREWRGRPCPAAEAEDLHTWIEERLTELAGEAGRKIHTARSRNDQVATLLRLYVIDAGERWRSGLTKFVRTACERAASWADALMPLLTHTQHAAPGSAGFWVLRYAVALDRGRRQLAAAIEEWQRYCPLGSGAVAGSSIPIDRRIQAVELGFAGPSRNALESTSTRDEVVELLAIGARIALHLQALATDVILFAQTPLAWVRYPPAFATGSSMMPNKVNPDAMELLRGEACAVAAAHGEVLAILKGLPSGYNRDLQCVKPVLHRAAETLVRLVDLAAAFLAELEFDPRALAAAARLGHIGATLRMEERVAAGTPLRAAHHAVAAVLAAAGDGAAPDGAAQGGAAQGGAAPWSENALARYRTLGSANPDEVRRVAAELLAGL